MKLRIKNMVCDRCRLVVEDTLKVCGIEYEEVRLGEVLLGNKYDVISNSDVLTELENNLNKLGFEVLDNKQQALVEQIKLACIRIIEDADGEKHDRMSKIISSGVGRDYNYLSNLFSTVEDVTIEKYYIAQRIEKVKELLLYEEDSLAEIAYKLGFSSVPHLSNQFKKTTGTTPGKFRSNRLAEKRKSIDNLKIM